MQSKPTFYLAVIALILIGAVGVLKINSVGNADKYASASKEHEKSSAAAKPKLFKSNRGRENKPFEPLETAHSNFTLILNLINNGQALEASKAVNEYYSSLSSSELASLKAALLSLAFGTSANDLSQTKSVLIATSTAFDDLDVWAYLGDVAMSGNDWNTAFNAHFRASELESNPIDLDALLKKLLISSSHLRSNFEGNNDVLSIKNLYQRLSNLHPNFQRFQYELAIASLNVGETDNAKRLLQLLIYDLELGDVSKQVLARLDAQTELEPEPDVAVAQPLERNIHANDIVVPLISVGSSFIVESIIDRTSAPLLLDTGASITSLSSQLIERLELQPTGQTIRLSTANGVTSARIYHLKQLRLGSLVLRNMLVAEIGLANNRNFQGLLGTDALNQLKPQYSYLIDNQESALIFRKR